MRYIRFLMTAAAAGAIAFALFGGTPEALGGVAVYLAAACLIGEYILPMLSHLSDELFDLHVRVERVVPSLNTDGGPEIGRLRVFVLDDDAPLITWVGFRTLMVSRGCYNLQAGEFRCALQEAYEQRAALRSFLLLLATVGNAVFLSCRLFCRCGRWFLRLIGVLIGVIVSSRHVFRSGQIGAAVGDGLYRWFSAIFLFVSNLSVYIPYWPVMVWADADSDGRLCAMGMKGALNRLLDTIQHTRYTGRFVRERALIMRAPVGWRMNRIRTMEDAANGFVQSAGQTISRGPLPQRPTPRMPAGQRRPGVQGGGGLIVPDGLGAAAGQAAETPVRPPERRPTGRIQIVRVTHRNQQ